MVEAAGPRALDCVYRESAYLLAFPEVAAAVEAGEIGSGLEHFLTTGRAEMAAGQRAVPPVFTMAGRGVPAPEGQPSRLHFDVRRAAFDEALYLALFPSVALSMTRGEVRSGYDHWLERGFRDTARGIHLLRFAAAGTARGQPRRATRTLDLPPGEYRAAFPGLPVPQPCRLTLPQYRALRFDRLLDRPFGINLFGPLAEVTSLGAAARDVLRAVQDAGLAVDVWPYDPSGSMSPMEAAWTRVPMYRINLLIVEPDRLPALFEAFPPGTFDDAYSIMTWPWQSPVYRPDLMISLIDVDEIWTGSRSDADIVAASFRGPVSVIPAPVRPEPFYGKPNLPPPGEAGRSFTFASYASFATAAEQRAALTAVRAFAEVAQDSPGLRMVLRVQGLRDSPSGAELMHATRQCPQIEWVECSLDSQEAASAREQADGLVAVHAGNSRVVAEYLACAKPVIAVAPPGTAEFFDDAVGYPVDCHWLGEDDRESGMVASQASLVAQIRHLVEDAPGRRIRALVAAERMQARHGLATCARSIAARLAALQLDGPKPAFMGAALRGLETANRLHRPGPVPSNTQPGPLFSLIEIVGRSTSASDVQAGIDAVNALRYEAWELIVRSDPACRAETHAAVAGLRGSAIRIRVQGTRAGAVDLVETARGAFVVFAQSLRGMRPDSLDRIAGVLAEEPACDAVSVTLPGVRSAGVLAIRTSLLIGMRYDELSPETVFSDKFRERLRAFTYLIRNVVGSLPFVRADAMR